jgi:hypothetical protein
MRLISVAVVGVALLAAAPADAAFWRERPQMPWCAVFKVAPGSSVWDCSYPTLEACIPYVIAGTRGFCNPNPRYQELKPRPRHRKH